MYVDVVCRRRRVCTGGHGNGVGEGHSAVHGGADVDMDEKSDDRMKKTAKCYLDCHTLSSS